MANTIPCPNPICTHQFALAELQAAAQLSCPKCGFRMQGKAAAKPAAPAKPIAVAKPAAASPAKPTVAPAAPKAAAPAVAQPKPAAPAPTHPKPALAQPVPAAALKMAMATPVAAQPKPAAPMPAMAVPPKSATPLAAPVVAPSKPASPVSAAPMPPLAAPVVAAPPAPVNEFAVGEPPPPAVPVTPTGEESIADGMFFNPDVDVDAGTLVRTKGKTKRKFNWMKALIIVFAVGFAACIVIVALTATLWWFLGTDGLGKANSGDAKGAIFIGQIRSKEGLEKVYKLALPKEDWEIDRDVLSRFEAHAAWKRKDAQNYEFWFAVSVQDYGVFKPRDAEMLRIGIDKLENFFGDALEIGKKAEPAKIGNLAAQKIEFKGQIKALPWSGECYMFFNNGIAYWLYIASPDKSTVEYFADELPKSNFFVESERRGWREQQPPTKTFAASNAKLTVTGLESVWEKTPNAKDIDENGVLHLFGKFKEKDNRKNATLLVFTFENKGDLKEAMKTARENLASKLKNENENYKVALAAEVTAGQTDIGTVEDIGNRRGRLVDLKRTFNDDPQRYFLFAVVTEGDTAYGILCDCSWESRQIWRQDFIDVMRTMNFKKGE